MCVCRCVRDVTISLCQYADQPIMRMLRILHICVHIDRSLCYLCEQRQFTDDKGEIDQPESIKLVALPQWYFVGRLSDAQQNTNTAGIFV